ncbi:MAG: hypothetical protein ACRDVK_01875 [Acidimicrobiia bacterium]
MIDPFCNRPEWGTFGQREARLGFVVGSGLMLIAGFLTAKKATDDLDAFRPGPPRLADLLVFAISLLVVVVVDLALAPQFDADPIAGVCRPPACVVISVS